MLSQSQLAFAAAKAKALAKIEEAKAAAKRKIAEQRGIELPVSTANPDEQVDQGKIVPGQKDEPNGQDCIQNVRQYTSWLREESANDYNLEGYKPWRLSYPKYFTAQNLRPMFKVVASEKMVRIMISLMGPIQDEPPAGTCCTRAKSPEHVTDLCCCCFCCCPSFFRHGPTWEDVTNAEDSKATAYSKMLVVMLKGQGEEPGANSLTFIHYLNSCFGKAKRTPLNDSNPGQKCAFLIEWFLRMYAPYSRGSVFDTMSSHSVAHVLEDIKKECWRYNFEAVLELLDENAAFTHHEKFPVLKAQFAKITATHDSVNPPSFPAVAICILHGFSISRYESERETGTSTHWCNQIVTYENGAFLPYIYKAVLACIKERVVYPDEDYVRCVFDFKGLPIRPVEGSPTSENAIRLMSNLISSGAIVKHAHLFNEDSNGEKTAGNCAEWQKITCDYWAQMLEPTWSADPGGYMHKAVAVDAASITLQTLLQPDKCTDGDATEIFFTKHFRRITMLYFGDSSELSLRNSMITLWLGMVKSSDLQSSRSVQAIATSDPTADKESAKNFLSRKEKLLALRIPLEMERILLDDPDENANFKNRTFHATQLLCLLIGKVDEHPMLNTAGRKMMPALHLAANEAKRKFKESEPRMKFQGVYIHPQQVITTMKALAHTTDNRYRMKESGVIHWVAMMMDTFYQEWERFEKKEKETNKKMLLLDIRDVMGLADILKLYARRQGIDVFQDLRDGLETENIDIRKILKFFADLKVDEDQLEQLGVNVANRNVYDNNKEIQLIDVLEAVCAQDRFGPAYEPSVPNDPNPGMNDHDVFLSYAWGSGKRYDDDGKGSYDDENFKGAQKYAVYFAEQLKKKGIKVFIDVRDMGTSAAPLMSDKMDKAVNASKVVVCFIDRHYNDEKSQNIKHELKCAKEYGKSVYPLLVNDIAVSREWLKAWQKENLPLGGEYMYHELKDPRSFDYAYDRSVKATKEMEKHVDEVYYLSKNGKLSSSAKSVGQKAVPKAKAEETSFGFGS